MAKYIKIRMAPERFWVKLSDEDVAQVLPLADGTFTVDKMIHGEVSNDLVNWPLRIGDIIPITAKTEILEIMDEPDVLDAMEIE